MLRLDSTLRKLQVVLAGAVATNQLPVVTCFSDKTSSDYAGGSTVINTNSTTAVDICAAPASSTVRDIDTISVFNADTVSATVTIRYNDNGTTYSIFKATLEVGDQLLYTHGGGWKVLNSTGSIKDGAGIIRSSSILGTITNDSAAAGVVGEYFFASVALASAISATNSASLGITSIDLTAGDWDVTGIVGVTTAATTTTTLFRGKVATTVSAISPNDVGSFSIQLDGVILNTPTNGAISSPTAVTRMSLSSTTTVYLVGNISFAVSTANLFGQLSARRVR